MGICDKWVTLKFFELLLCIACVVCKRVTDDETRRVHLVLQRFSREWSLLRDITWGRVGTALGDATYGGYTIITAGLLIARFAQEIPQGRRILEFFLLGLGAFLFVVLGCLELFSIDEVPDNLVDNAIVLGTLSMLTALLFLIDLAGPRQLSAQHKSYSEKRVSPSVIQTSDMNAKNKSKRPTSLSVNATLPEQQQQQQQPSIVRPQTPVASHKKTQDMTVTVLRPQTLETTFPAIIETEMITDWEPYKPKTTKSKKFTSSRTSETQTTASLLHNGRLPSTLYSPNDGINYKNNNLQYYQNGSVPQHYNVGTLTKLLPDPPAWMKSTRPPSPITKPLKIETVTISAGDINNNLHSPVWARIRPPAYKAHAPELIASDIKKSSILLPMPALSEHVKNGDSSPETAQSSPNDPGFVQYTAGKWGQNIENTKTPRHSPTNDTDV